MDNRFEKRESGAAVNEFVADERSNFHLKLYPVLIINALFCTNAIMVNSKTILTKFISIVLTFIFAFSITPAVVFHNLFSGHTDHAVQHHHKQSNEVAKAGINCHFNSFVCRSSFIDFFAPQTFVWADNKTTYLVVRSQHFYSQHHFFAELRGPPVQA